MSARDPFFTRDRAHGVARDGEQARSSATSSRTKCAWKGRVAAELSRKQLPVQPGPGPKRHLPPSPTDTSIRLISGRKVGIDLKVSLPAAYVVKPADNVPRPHIENLVGGVERGQGPAWGGAEKCPRRGLHERPTACP